MCPCVLSQSLRKANEGQVIKTVHSRRVGDSDDIISPKGSLLLDADEMQRIYANATVRQEEDEKDRQSTDDEGEAGEKESADQGNVTEYFIAYQLFDRE